VTGASKGIGAAIARRFGAEGASVVVNYASSKADADRVVAAISGEGGKAVAVQADMAKETDVRRLMDEARRLGPIDILVNNAGVYEFLPVDQVTPEHFHRQYNVNVLGPLLATREAVARFNPAGGSIINISSVVSVYTPPGSAVYSGTKAAVDAMTRVLAKELGPRKIRVNAINPGMVETEGVHAAGLAEGDFRRQAESTTPLGRIGQPRDITPAAVFLASDEASWITGETLVISGGLR
jgi:3-oxoacyl-[acyl-carrier protein] reductase